MTEYKALAWDDKPEEYLNRLVKELEGHNIAVDVEKEQGAFLSRFAQDYWDFLILDVIDEISEPEQADLNAGIRLADRIRRNSKRIPIVFITEARQIPTDDFPIVGPTLLRSKSLTHWEMALDIADFCKTNVVDTRKVFLIYGHDQHSGDIRSEVEMRLKDSNLRVEMVKPENVTTTLISALIAKMEPCGGVIAICTPDDKVNDNHYQPRQNVLMEIGVAMGIARGSERLIILQRWGAEAKYQAQLPSNLGGELAIRFFRENNHRDTLDKLVDALKERGLRVSEAKQDR